MLLISGCTSADKYQDPANLAEEDPIIMPGPEKKIHGSMSMSIGTGRGYGGYGHPLDDARTFPRAVDGWGPGLNSSPYGGW